MNFFEFDDIDINKKELNLNDRDEESILLKFDEYFKYNDCTNINVKNNNGEVTCRPSYFNNAKFILICMCPTIESDETTVSLYIQNETNWVHSWDINLSKLIMVEGLRAIKVDYYRYHHTSNILLIVFRSPQSLHVARINVVSSTITDIIAFHPESNFQPGNATFTDLIIGPNTTTSLLLVDQTHTNNAQYCPTVTELQSVLTRRLLSGVHSLLTFWTTQLTDIQEYATYNPPASLIHGIPLTQYISFIHIHQAVLLQAITNHCRNDTAPINTSNMFLEHLTNMINDYINETVNLIISMQVRCHNDFGGRDIINRMLGMLCDNSRIYRDLVLTYRPTLSGYQRLIFNRPVTKIKNDDKLRSYYDAESLQSMDQSKMVSECLKTRRIAALQIYRMQRSGGWTTDKELTRQSEVVILASVQCCDWNDLNNLVTKLGHRPIETLTALCYDTQLKRIRDYLYYHLDLDQSNILIKCAKNFVDQLEMAYTINVNEISNPSFRLLFFGNDTDRHSSQSYDHLHSFIEGLDKSKCRHIRQVLDKNKFGDPKAVTHQLININLNTFLQLLNESKSDEVKSVVSDAVELCLMDADYRRLLMQTSGGLGIPQDRLIIWIYKWRKNAQLFVCYVTESCDVELIKAVIDTDFSADNVIGTKLIDQLTSMLFNKEDSDYTDIDRHIAKEAMVHILTQYPECLISRLEQLYCNDLAKAKDILLMISQTLAVHLLCQSHGCPLKKGVMKDSPLLTLINRLFVERIIANSCDSEFPIVFFYLVKDFGVIMDISNIKDHYSIRKASLLQSVVTNRLPVDTFNCLISRDISISNGDELTAVELDEIAYTALLSGISYNDILESAIPTVVSIRKILADGNYWHRIKTRLLRPADFDSKTCSIEQYYEVNLYQFLHRSGIPLALGTIFVNQAKNTFSNKGKVLTGVNNISVPMMVAKKNHLPNEPSKESLNYIYYLSLGRPYQAFCSIQKEFAIAGKPGYVQLDVMKDLVTSIYQMALSNIDDRLIIGGCFGLLRLIGSSTELLRCYLTLIQWVIDWHVQINDHGELTELTESTQSQSSESDQRIYYTTKTVALFKFCLSNNSTERKNSRDLLIRQIEDIFINRLCNEHYKEIKDILHSWSIVLYFCQMHGAQFSTAILQYYASIDQWLLFLSIAEVFGYSKDQVKETLNQFEDVSIRQHMSYIVNKVDDLSPQSAASIEDFSRASKTTTDPINRLNVIQPGTLVLATDIVIGNNDTYNINDSHPIKDFPSFKSRNHNKYSMSALRNSAKNNLFELIFDCQIESNNRTEISPDRKRTNDIRLNIRKLLAYCLALGHPFISVLAFSSNSYNDDLIESSIVNKLDVYRNCLSCFIVSSSPKRIQEIIWAKWAGIAKLDWSEEDLIDLVVFAIENGFVNVVSQAFSVLRAEKFTAVSAFFAMVSHALEHFNPILRDAFLAELVKDCQSNTTIIPVKDRQRGKFPKNTTMTFVNKLLGTSLVAALQVSERTQGARSLYEWLKALSNSSSGLLQSHVKSVFPFTETNIYLLSLTLSVYFDFIDLGTVSQTKAQFQPQVIPVNTRNKEFMQFVETLVDNILEKLNSCSDYTRVILVESTLVLVVHINSLHSIQLPSNHDKWKANEIQLKSMSIRKIDSNLINPLSLTDLVSMALAGQSDKMETVSLCTYDDQCSDSCFENASSAVNDIAGKSHGTSNSWRRLIIPEEWQNEILNLPHRTSADNLEKISHVSCLLNEGKWIEACSYMREHEFSAKDAVLILTSMRVASGNMDPAKLPVLVKEYFQPRHSESIDKEPTKRFHVRRMSVQMNSSASKLNVMLPMDNELNFNKTTRPIKSGDTCQQFLTKASELVIHGQTIMECICTIHCVATKMSESYLSVASGEEFDVLTKILVGACRDKIDTADMYLGVVDIDTEQLCNFIAEVIVQVLRLEIETYIGSTSVMTSPSFRASTSLSPIGRNSVTKTPFFVLTPPGPGSPKSPQSSSPSALSRRTGNTAVSHNSTLSLHENTLRVAERCQLRSEWRTVPSIKMKPENRLIKAFTLQDILILSPNSRKLGKILFSHYQRFSQEVTDCNEDAEFLVHLLVQCHNCFTDGGDTIGISNCLKAAKELTRLLNTNGYFVLMAQLLCRIGRYGEMPYIFSNLIENHQFEQLFRKDMDKDGVIVPYVFDYLNRYHNDDYEKMEMVCNRYNCYYELAETKSKMANLSIAKLKVHFGANTVRETAKMLTTSIINCLLDACKSYLKAGCYKKMEEHFRKAQFYKLQQKWLEDPDKTFPVGPLNRSNRISLGKVILPETGLPNCVQIINLNSEQALAFLKKIPNFYTAFIMSDQLKLPLEIWLELLMHHVLINGDETYLRHYMLYFGPVISCNLLQQCLNRLERSSVKLTNKHGLTNLKTMLNSCDDVFFARRISDLYKLNK